MTSLPGESEVPNPKVLLSDEIDSIRSVLGHQLPEGDVIRALSASGNNVDRAINILLDAPKRESEPLKKGADRKPLLDSAAAAITGPEPNFKVGKEESPENKTNTEEEAESDSASTTQTPSKKKAEDLEEGWGESPATARPAPYLNPRPIRAIGPPAAAAHRRAPPGAVANRRLQALPDAVPPELEEFPDEPDWFLVRKTYVTALSTCRGWRKLEAGEVVHFAFPKNDARKKFGRHWVSAKTAAATSEIVRFSTKRSGEIGRLPTEWSRCLIPLVNSSKVKVRGRCAIPPVELSLMQDIVLYASFYIHSSIFTEGDNSSWKLVAPSQIDSTLHPLLTLFKLLNNKPERKAEFTPEELDTRKRSLNLKDGEESEPIVGLAKKRRGDKSYIEQSKDEQAISESSLNKLVGAADVYNLKEAEPPSTLTCELWPYQKQALFWMSELEKGTDVEEATKTLHPCWAAYRIGDKKASTIYVNVFSGEATTKFPCATQIARGGMFFIPLLRKRPVFDPKTSHSSSPFVKGLTHFVFRCSSSKVPDVFTE